MTELRKPHSELSRLHSTLDRFQAWKYLLVLFLLSLPLSSHASKNLNGYFGVGPNYIPFSAFRVGISGWEAGVLAPKAFGGDYRFNIGKNYYTAIGLALTIQGPSSGGLFGAIGCEYDLIAGLTFRAELNSVTAANGFSQASGIVGAAYHFGGRQ